MVYSENQPQNAPGVGGKYDDKNWLKQTELIVIQDETSKDFCLVILSLLFHSSGLIPSAFIRLRMHKFT